MNYISTTGLRSPTKLIEALLAGKTVKLFHRSKYIGKVVPVKKSKKPKKDFVDVIKSIPKIKGLTWEKAEKIYRDHMMKKHGKYLP